MTTETLDDYKHYYDGCFGIYNNEKIVYVNEVTHPKHKLGFEIKGNYIQDFVWYPFVGNSLNMKYPLPELGYINIYDTVVLVKRLPLRQWKKGVIKATLEFEFPPILQKIDVGHNHEIWNLRKDNVHLVYSIFNRRYMSYHEATPLIESGEKMCVALSNNIALSITESDKIGVYYYNRLVGFVHNNTLHISKDSLLLKEEIQQSFPTGFGVEIHGH